MSTHTVTDDDAESLRQAFVDDVLSVGPLPEPIVAALRAVPRHVFVPRATVTEAYTDDVVVTRRDSNQVATSSSSAPWLMMSMLRPLQVQPGMNVLEIGTGTGYNAGILSQMVGPDGAVTSIEITPDVAEEARNALATAGYSNVEVVCGDGRDGYAPNGLYDRIIVTAGIWEIPQAFAEQLAPGGILVVPLRIKGFTRSVALRLDGDGVWRGSDTINCGFMPVRGADAVIERNVQLADDLTIRFDDNDSSTDEDNIISLHEAAQGRHTTSWTGVDLDCDIDLLDYCMADLDGYCRILAPDSIVQHGLAAPLNGWGSMGIATRDALGYLTTRVSANNPRVHELGICAYGPGAEAALAQLQQRITRWTNTQDAINAVTIEIHPIGHPIPADAIMTVEKRHSIVVVRGDEAVF